MSTIGSRIKYYRLLNNLTQEQLAIKSNVDRCTINRYENNLVDYSLDIVNEIAIALEIIPSLIYDDYLNFISSNYGDEIQYMRRSLKLTQEEFGDILGVHKKTIRMWEKQQAYPTRENFIKIKIHNIIFSIKNNKI
ncbi:helix-turn-helix domain-containing protein [Tissierella carlieri]|uniref:Helix-turn-helix domain-containing protein n=1 Tax=Tissierella carlieri TaxID=689904 RepID=A0ABT1S535_9FIRM|nr:helix-turn-helix transcriptional regulator [Tissierella carlieri]MCQ4921576.1 helix-turn-helix domain-containing protein [Tissierella carlieri]